MSDNLNKIHAKNEEKTSTQTSIPTAIHSFFSSKQNGKKGRRKCTSSPMQILT